MILDKRIKSKSDILTCFDLEQSIQFIGQKGYFSDCLALYRCLASRKYGILTEIKDSDCPFKEGNNEHWGFFIPESRLEPVEQVEKTDEISILKYKVEKLEKNLIELKHELNNQKTIYNRLLHGQIAVIQ